MDAGKLLEDKLIQNNSWMFHQTDQAANFIGKQPALIMVRLLARIRNSPGIKTN